MLGGAGRRGVGEVAADMPRRLPACRCAPGHRLPGRAAAAALPSTCCRHNQAAAPPAACATACWHAVGSPGPAPIPLHRRAARGRSGAHLAGQDAAADADVAGEGALLVDVVAWWGEQEKGTKGSIVRRGPAAQLERRQRCPPALRRACSIATPRAAADWLAPCGGWLPALPMRAAQGASIRQPRPLLARRRLGLAAHHIWLAAQSPAAAVRHVCLPPLWPEGSAAPHCNMPGCAAQRRAAAQRCHL